MPVNCGAGSPTVRLESEGSEANDRAAPHAMQRAAVAAATPIIAIRLLIIFYSPKVRDG
jgi:hypothetical protein